MGGILNARDALEITPGGADRRRSGACSVDAQMDNVTHPWG
jgi:hypothetical protein